MNKKVAAPAAIVVAVVTVTLVVLSVSTLSLPFNYKAEGQLDNNSSSNNNNTANSLKTTATTTGPQASAINNSNSVIVQQGTVASGPPMEPGDPTHIAQILQPRPDGSVYTGTVTFTASKKVDVFVLHPFGKSNSSLINSTYREPASFSIGPNQRIAPSLLIPDYRNSFIPSASIPFSGNALGFITFNNEPFIVTYTLKADIDKPQIVNNITNALVKTATIPTGIKVSIIQGAAAIMTDKAFSPNPVSIKEGDTITWINNDVETHTVTSGLGFSDPNLGKQFDSGFLGEKQTFSHKFNTSGQFNYFCELHPAMVGKVSVK
jgi:plastocyanin